MCSDSPAPSGRTAKTAKGPDDFRKLADEKGFMAGGKLRADIKVGQVIAWLKEDFELGHGHAMAIAALLKGTKQEGDESLASRSPRPGHPTSVGISNASLGMERRGASPFDHALVTLSPRTPAILVRECPRRSVRADEREPHGFSCALRDRARAIRPATSGRQPLHACPRRWARSCPAEGRPAHRRVTLRSDSTVA